MLESLDSFLSRETTHLDSILEYNMLDQEGCMILYGQTGTWKSWLAMELARAVGMGEQWLIFPSNINKVGIINTELTIKQYQSRWEPYVRKRGINSENLAVYNPLSIKVGNGAQMKLLGGEILRRGIKLMILDNVYSSMSGDAKTNEDMREFTELLDYIRFQCHCAVCLIHHTRQPNMDFRGKEITTGEYDMFGSSYLPNWADTIVEVKNKYVEGMRDCVTINFKKHRTMDYPPIDALYKFDRHGLKFEVVI